MLKRDGFEDILEERRNSSDLKYALRCYAPVLYKGVTPCKANMLKNIVLQSDQLHYVINQVGNQCHSPHVQSLSLVVIGYRCYISVLLLCLTTVTSQPL